MDELADEKLSRVGSWGVMRKCKSPLCNHIIYYYQDSWFKGYCDEECKIEARRFNSIKRDMERLVEKEEEKQQTDYHHKNLPIVLTID